MKVLDVDSLSADPLKALRELSRVGVELEEVRRQRVEAARRQGASWEQIAESLGMSRQSTWEYYTRDVRQVLDETAGSSELDEAEAIQTATEEVNRVRRRRRRVGS